MTDEEARRRRAADPWFAAVPAACHLFDPIAIAFAGELEYAAEAADIAWLLPRMAKSARDCARLAGETFHEFFGDDIAEDGADVYPALGEQLWVDLRRLDPVPPPGERPLIAIRRRFDSGSREPE